MKHFLLFYETGDNYLERRAPFRDLHLKHAWAASARGELVLAGALGDPVEGAVLLFKGDSARGAEEFAKADPYVVNGLITRWTVKPWTTVAGDAAANPVHPQGHTSVPPIVRLWKGTAPAETADDYFTHVTGDVLARIAQIPGFLRGRVLRRERDAAVDFLIATEWASWDAIHAFAGSNPDAAVINPHARAFLSAADERVEHFELVYETS
jgi:uncharacterized protein YciI/heme-degrading monooxygenase HmoA